MGTAWPVWLMLMLATLNTSGNATNTAKLEFLVRLRYWLVSGGMMMRIACGKMTKRSRCAVESPNAAAASNWPFEIARILPRTISAMNVPV